MKAPQAVAAPTHRVPAARNMANTSMGQAMFTRDQLLDTSEAPK